MTTADFTLSFMLRNSSEALAAVEHTDVKLARRDGPDLLVGTVRREAAVRDSLDLAARVGWQNPLTAATSPWHSFERRAAVTTRTTTSR